MSTTFRGEFDYIVLLCPTFLNNKKYDGLAENERDLLILTALQGQIDDWLKIISIKPLIAYEKHQENRTELLDWSVTNDRVKEQAKQNFVDAVYALKLYNKVHNRELDLREPKLSVLYKPSVQQKQAEMIYVRGTALALGLATSRFL